MSGGKQTYLLDISHLESDQIADIVSHVRGISEPEEPTYPVPEHGWTCFHCGQTFKTWQGARLHFGKTPKQERPLCVQ